MSHDLDAQAFVAVVAVALFTLDEKRRCQDSDSMYINMLLMW